jgi:hypothetical protein
LIPGTVIRPLPSMPSVLRIPAARNHGQAGMDEYVLEASIDLMIWEELKTDPSVEGNSMSVIIDAVPGGHYYRLRETGP